MSRNINAILRSVELAKAQRVRRNHTTADFAAPDPVVEDYKSFTAFREDYATNEYPDCKAVTPGLVKVSARPEPKSIYSPAGHSKIQFERPRRRSSGKSLSRDCELPPEKRKNYTLRSTSGHTIEVNPFSKRIAVSGPGYR
jgi:hypothetical protein